MAVQEVVLYAENPTPLRKKCKPGIIAIPSYSDNEAAQALSAHAITLTPGELVVEMGDDGIMYTHCLDATETEKYIEQAQAQRISMLEKIFPSISSEDTNTSPA